MASDTNEQFYRRQCEKLKEKSINDVALSEALRWQNRETKEKTIQSHEFKKSIIKAYVKRNQHLKSSLRIMKIKFNKIHKLKKHRILQKVD